MADDEIEAAVDIGIAISMIVIPVTIGSTIVVVPYVTVLLWVAEIAGGWGGKLFGDALMTVLLLLTILPVAVLVIMAVTKIDGWVPWEGVWQ